MKLSDEANKAGKYFAGKRATDYMTTARLALVFVAGMVVAGCRNDTRDVTTSRLDDSAVNKKYRAAQEPTETLPLQFLKPKLTTEEIRDGWISLFDGVSLFGWNVPQGPNWHIEDHCLVADSGEPGLLMTSFKFNDFEFRCDFHLESGGNSGVFLRTAEDAKNPATDTYELNICDSHDSFPTGSLVARCKADGVPCVEGEWHSVRVLCDGMRIRVWLDEKPIIDFTDESENYRSAGKIGLQMNGGRIAFRNVFLRPVGTTELFNGQSLEGWSVVAGSQSQFEVVEMTSRDSTQGAVEVNHPAIHISNGPGFLQTDSVYADFVLQMDVRVNGNGLNSGVFFRAMPGIEAAPSNGYEMQIHNGYRDDDRTRPTDFGTGAIFRREAVRYVVADDREWFTATLMVQGDRIATWVNGYQVVNWRDTREPNENPRRGKQLDAGHLSLQGHDPTTDLDFRSVRIHDLTVQQQEAGL